MAKNMSRKQQKAMFAKMNDKGSPKRDGSGKGVRANYNRGGCNTSKEKNWTMYHGTHGKYVKQIEKEGLNPSNYRLNRLYLTPDKEIAEKYAKKGAKYPGEKKKTEKREPAVFKIKIEESDFDKQSKDPKVVKIRKKNLDRAIDEDWHEYVYYYPIKKENIERIK